MTISQRVNKNPQPPCNDLRFLLSHRNLTAAGAVGVEVDTTYGLSYDVIRVYSFQRVPGSRVAVDVST